ncbi:down syndrome cell adhesion molecule-like protein Dscam2 [Trichonephila clavipes]|nr:down syndrome cell adhesion molecule-like protein Dscam2 [Trichonephila clavipes]
MLDLGSNPGEGMSVCKCIVPLRHEGILNSLQATSPLVMLLGGKERCMASGHPHDPPGIPVIKTYYATSTAIKLSWELSALPSAPISGYILHHRLEDHHWQETHLNGDQNVYTLRDLQCGSTYYIYLVAFNSVNQGNSSEHVLHKLLQGVKAFVHQKVWFMNDGAPAHFSIVVRHHLNGTHPGWIENHVPFSWSSLSPDLNPLDFFFWDNLKPLTYETPETIAKNSMA